MSEDNFLKTLKLLEASFTSTDTNNIQEIQNQLDALSQNKEEYINNLLKALSIDIYNNFNISLNLHKSIAIYLKNFTFSKLLKSNKEEILTFLNSLLDVMFNSGQEHLINPSISQILNDIINKIISTNEFLNDNQNLTNLLNLLLNEMKKTEKIIMKSNIVISLLNTLISGKCINGENLESFIYQYLFPISDIIFDNTKIFVNSQTITYEYFEILKGICEIFYSILFKLKFIQNKNSICSQFLSKYNNILSELFSFKIPDKEIDQNQIIYFKEDKNYNDINFMKAKALQVYTTIIQTSTNADEAIQSQEFIKTCSNIIDIIIKSLTDLLNDESKYEILIKSIYFYNNPANNPLENIIYQFFAFLTRALIREPFKSQFFPFLPNFLLNIVFPLITTNKYDKDNMKIEGENYYNNISDMFCEFQRKSYRTAACFLIKKLYEKIIDIRSFILSFTLQMLQFILSDSQNINNIQFKVYLENKNNTIIDKFDDETKIDFCFLILLIFKDNLPQLSGKAFQNLIIQNQIKLNNIDSELIRCKLCNIYQYYYDEFIKENNTIEFNQNTFNFLMNSLLKSKENEGLGFCASNALVSKFNVDEEEEEENLKTIPFLSDVINKDENLNKINKLINEVDIIPFFDFLKEVFSNIEISNRNLLIDCLRNLVLRLQNEFLKPNNDFSSAFVSSAFKILRSFINGDNKIKLNEIESFSELISPIVNYIKNPKKIDFVDDIINLVDDLMNSNKMILPISVLIFQNLESICNNYSSINDSVYDFISTYFKYINNNKSGVEINELNNEIIKILKLNIDLQLTETKNNYMLISFRVIANNSFNNDNSMLEYLLKKIISFYEKTDNDEEEEEEDDENLFSNLISISTLYVSFIYFPVFTYNILSSSDNLFKIVDLIQEVIALKKEVYSISLGKCVVLGICSILNNSFCIEELRKSNKLNYLINSLFELVIKQKKSETAENKNLMKKELNCNFVEEDENSDSDFIDFIELEDEKELVDETINDNENIKNSDIYQYFTNTMKNLENYDKNLVDNFVHSLSDLNKNALENLIHTRQVKINYKEEEIYIPRRTVKIKRTHNQ